MSSILLHYSLQYPQSQIYRSPLSTCCFHFQSMYYSMTSLVNQYSPFSALSLISQRWKNVQPSLKKFGTEMSPDPFLWCPCPPPSPPSQPQPLPSGTGPLGWACASLLTLMCPPNSLGKSSGRVKLALPMLICPFIKPRKSFNDRLSIGWSWPNPSPP